MDDLDQISGQVEADRARLAQSLDALTETVNPQKLAQDATAAVNDLHLTASTPACRKQTPKCVQR